MRNLNLDQLQTLIAVADLGTLAAAAQALHLSPPAVSLHIRELETRLGATLVVRGRRQAQLTPAGKALVQGGRQLLAGAEQVAEQVRRRADGREGVVRLGTSAGVSTHLLPKVLTLLAQNSPGVDIKLEVLSSAEAMARLGAGTLDIGIVAMPQASAPEVRVVPWRNDPMVAFVPPDWDAPDLVTPGWLAERAWISFGPATQMYLLIATWFSQAGLYPRPRMQLNYPEAIKSLVAAGLAAAVLPLEQPGDGASDASLQVRKLSPALVRPLGLAHRMSETGEVAIQAVLQTLAEFSDA
jgi:DNA-binding transcriptional LysR family regulator